MPYLRTNGSIYLKMAVSAIVLLIASVAALAQTTSAALSGVVTDATGARISGASVVLTNQNTRDKRSNKANGSGEFNFSGLTPGEYTVTVSFKGFDTFVEKDIALHPGDSSSLPTIEMKAGAEDVTITVSAHDEVASNGEVASLITADDIKHLATEGRDVTELVKILPGFSLQGGSTSSGGLSNSSPDSQVAGPGSGSLGSYAAAGAPQNGVGVISDGANVQDPGQGGATTQTINMDMVEEVKVSTSNFGADVAKGPVVINAVGKSGGATYHGSLYTVARITQLNSNDWLLKDQGIAKPPDRYIYPGANVGGPILIPGTNFNHDRKLLFEAGGEIYAQRNAFSGGSASTALRLSTVPTDAMRGGLPCPAGSNLGGNCADFSTNSIANLFNVGTTIVDPNSIGNPMVPVAQQDQCTTTGRLVTFINYCQAENGQDPTGLPISNGYIASQNLDPGALAYLKLIPHQNRLAQPVAGTNQDSDGFDRIDEYLTNYNLYQIRGRVDYNASQNNKFYVVYNTQQGTNYQPFTLYYNPNYNNGIIRDPSLIHSGSNSQTGSANYLRVFGPTLTNELFAAGAFYVNQFYPLNEAAQTIAGTGYPYGTALKTGSTQIPQLGYSQGVPLFLAPDFSINTSYARKASFDFGDNLTKVWRSHTIKVGFYFERTANNQRSTLGATQGQFAEYGVYSSFQVPQSVGSSTYHQTSPDNALANFELGYTNSFTQQSANPITDLDYKGIDGYITDSWKATKKLTLSGGVRFDHLGPWTEPHGIGGAFWDPSTYYTPEAAYGVIGVPLNKLPGITWHGVNKNVPSAVQDGRWAFVSPRAGFSYDVYGNGKTVFTGGAGMYRSHDAYNDYVNAVSTAEGVYTATYGGGIGVTSNGQLGVIGGSGVTLKCVSELGQGTAANDPTCNNGLPYNPVTNPGPMLSQNLTAPLGSSFTVAALHDDQQPLTTNYSFGVNQAFPHLGNVIINYVGNQSSHLLFTNAFGSNINAIQQGGLFRPNPNPFDAANFGQIVTGPDSLSSATLDDYRPYPLYNGLYLLRHGLHSTYHSLQVSWNKWNGPFHYNFNYTWSKALGDRGADGNSSTPDATNFRNDYGITAYDRTHIFNASYSYTEGSPWKGNHFIGGFINGWEISGILNLQSGPNLQAAFSNNFSLTAVYSNGSTTSTDNKTYLGTPDIFFQPVTTCDPSRNLHSGQFVNGNCLTIGPQGVNGPFHYPYMRGPGYFHTDLSGQKSFHMGEKKEIQIRFAAFNFVNHALTSLVAATANPLKLIVSGPGQPANGAFGISDYKEGRRICEMAVHYNF